MGICSSKKSNQKTIENETNNQCKTCHAEFNTISIEDQNTDISKCKKNSNKKCSEIPCKAGCRAYTKLCFGKERDCTGDEFCEEYPDHRVCNNAPAEDREVCCTALTISCQSCKLGIDEEEYCKEVCGDEKIWEQICIQPKKDNARKMAIISKKNLDKSTSTPKKWVYT